MRYVRWVDDAPMFDPMTGDSVKPDPERGVLNPFPFKRALRSALALAVQTGACDALDFIDLRKKLDEFKPKGVMELTDAQWKIIEGEFRRPKPHMCGVNWVLYAEAQIRSVLDAPTEKPKDAAEALS